MNYNIAIVDNEERESDRLESLLDTYAKNKGLDLNIQVFNKPLNFVDKFKIGYDIVFLDIEMGEMNGIEVAERIRKVDDKVTLIFVTSFSQYAIKGYDYAAYSYILKPIEQYKLFSKLDSLFSLLSKEREQNNIPIKTKDGTVLMDVGNIYYLEIRNHRMTYFTKSGTYDTFESMKESYGKLGRYDFALVNQSILVNLKYVEKVERDGVVIDGRTIFFSRLKKKEFLESFSAFLSERI